MIGELLCPDCGGVVGALESSEAGPPCRCFIPRPSTEESTPEPLTEPLTEPPPAEVAEVSTAKICRVCGKDVTLEKRAKDHQGYYCIACVKEEEKREHQGRVRCRVCGHLHKEEMLTEYEGTRMCVTCHRERTDALKQQIKKIGIKGARTRAEIQQIYNICMVLGALLLIIVLSAIYVAHKH